MFRAEFFHVPVIPLQVCQQLVEPVLPLAVCGYGGDYSERIDVAHLVDVDGFVDSAAYFFVRSHDVGDLQSCDVECFAGGYAGDGMSRECFRQGGKRNVGMSRVGQFAMYFVGHHRHVVAEADFADLHQFLPCPHPSGGIVGIAE